MAKATTKAATKKTPSKKTAAKKTTSKKAAAVKTPAKKVGAPPQRVGKKPLYWLFKSEPDKFSWDDLKAKGKQGEEWDGVRNYLARNNMREMPDRRSWFFLSL